MEVAGEKLETQVNHLFESPLGGVCLSVEEREALLKIAKLPEDMCFKTMQYLTVPYSLLPSEALAESEARWRLNAFFYKNEKHSAFPTVQARLSKGVLPTVILEAILGEIESHGAKMAELLDWKRKN